MIGLGVVYGFVEVWLYYCLFKVGVLMLMWMVDKEVCDKGICVISLFSGIVVM